MVFTSFFVRSTHFTRVSSLCPPTQVPLPRRAYVRLGGSPTTIIFRPIFTPEATPPFSTHFDSGANQAIPTTEPIRYDSFDFVGRGLLQRFALVVSVTFRGRLWFISHFLLLALFRGQYVMDLRKTKDTPMAADFELHALQTYRGV